MLISDKYKYIFIAIPKTGTTTIQNYLLENDDSCRWNSVEIAGNKIEIKEHIKTKDLAKLMGNTFNQYTVFTFIRNPFSRRVSGYFFYKNGDTKKSRYFIRNFMAHLNVVLTKVLPFSIWSIVKPQKKLVDYFFDEKNNILIDLVGKTESLDKDLSLICKKIGIPLKSENILVRNRSKHSSVEQYYSDKLHKRLYSKIIKGDIELYEKFKNTIYTENHKSKKF